MGLANRDPLVGLTLDGKYEIVRPLARGGMGRVYRAVQRPLGREVALKVLDMEQLEGQKAGGDFAHRFFLEAAACAQLTHPNTVVVYDYGCAEDEVFYIAMELLDGPTLERVLKQAAPLDPAVTVHLGLQICGSLGEAHQRGMVHRDLKPSNVMLIHRGADANFVKVLDFGLVKQDDHGLTQSGALLGTPRYISPEQIASSDVGPESDIYSLGAVLYHCLTGRPPFDAESQFALLASHMSVTPAPIETVQPDTLASAQLRAVVMRCLAKDPADRYPSMEALAEALVGCPEESGTAPSSLISSAGGLSDLGAEVKAAAPDHSGIKPTEQARTRAERPAAKSLASPPSRAPLVAAALIGILLGVGAIVGSRLFEEPTDTNPPARQVTVTAEPLAPAAEASARTAPADLTEEPRAPATEAAARTAPAASTSPVVVESHPTGVRVRHDGRDLGDTPLNLVIPDGERWTLVLSLPGYETREIVVTSGQGAVRATLERRRRGRRMRSQAREESPSVETPSSSDAPPSAAAVMMEPPTNMPSRPRTDNRDPWAR